MQMLELFAEVMALVVNKRALLVDKCALLFEKGIRFLATSPAQRHRRSKRVYARGRRFRASILVFCFF